MSKTHPYPERQLPDDQIVPSMETIGPVVDQVVAIAREQLERPITVKLWTWEDGGFKVRIKHGYGKGIGTRYHHETAIQYHSRREVVEGFLVEEDLETGDEQVLLKEELAEISDPVPRKDEEVSPVSAP